MDLSRRERQIMVILYRLGEATASEVMDGLDDPPSYSGVRAMLRILEDKGHVTHRQDGPRYVFSPTVGAEKARQSATDYFVRSFFDGSAARAVAALLDFKGEELSDNDLDRLSNMIEQAKKEGK